MNPARMLRDACRTLAGTVGLAIVLACGALAQDTAGISSPDSLQGGPQDTVAQGSPSGIDSVVTYAASDSIVYAIPGKTMMMYGKASIRYKELGLKAEHVEIDWNTSTLTARGVADSTDSTGYRGLPVMTEGGDVYDGSVVYYNFKSRKGRIDLGKTEIEKGRYFGSAIKKVGPDVLFVEDGQFYTCELDHPHYYFASPEMKVVVKDQVVARPVYLYIADVPVFALPFGVFPSKRGRHSGVLTPTFGESSRGRYLRNLGYYWAINDYMDLNLRGDVYSKGGYTLYADARYALRYAFMGGISGSFGRVISGDVGDPDYNEGEVFNVRLSHNQEFDPTMRLVVDMTFSSSSYYQQTSLDLNQLLQQNIVSNATLTKFWEGTPLSLTLNYRRDQNLQPQPNIPEVTEILPNVAFAVSQMYPFRSSKSAPGASSRWYELLGFTYSGQLLNQKTVTPLVSGAKTYDERRGILHQVNLTLSPKVGYFNITPFFGYVEKWYDRKRNEEIADSQLAVSVDRGFSAVRYFSTGISASTKLYGIVQPGLLGITALRHQLIPSVSYTYQPDWSDPRYGYYGTYTDTSGNQVKYDRYAQTAFGGAPAGERQAISFSLGNVFEMKTASRDTSAQENKYQILNLGFTVSYNLAADSLRFSEVGMDFRTSIADLLSIGGNTRFNLYRWQENPARPGTGSRVDKFLLDEGKLWDVTAFSISVGTRLSGEKIATSSGPERTEGDSLEAERKRSYVSLYDERPPDFSIPWNLDLTWNFSQNTPDPVNTYKSSTFAAQLGFNLTRAWKISASMNYDILRRQISAPQITVYRDLHCWELNFSWVPIGQYRNYRLEIRLKSPMLRDLKVTRQGSAAGIY